MSARLAFAAVAAPLVTVTVVLSAQAPGSLAALGVTEGRAKEAVFETLAIGTPSMVGEAAVFKAASDETKVLFVRTVTTLARAYMESDEFKARWADHREANQPDPPGELRTADEIIAKQKADWEDQVKEIRGLFPEITPEQRAALEQGFVEMRERFAAMETNGYKKELTEAIAAQKDEQDKIYAVSLQAFEQQFPQDPRTIIAARLRQFLDATSDVDFTAALVERGGKMRFADERYETKRREWKMCYRAGKPATDAARAFAQGWLKELESAGVR